MLSEKFLQCQEWTKKLARYWLLVQNISVWPLGSKTIGSNFHKPIFVKPFGWTPFFFFRSEVFSTKWPVLYCWHHWYTTFWLHTYIMISVSLLTGEERCMPVFTSWNGHPHAAGAEPAEEGRHGHGPRHGPKQHHSTLRRMIFRDGALKTSKTKFNVFGAGLWHKHLCGYLF